MGRRRGRRRRRGSLWKANFGWAGVCILSLVLVLLITPITSYTTAGLDRQSGIDVSTDDTALVGLQKASSIEEGQESRMVSVGNNFTGIEIEVVVELTSPSRSEGELMIGGIKQGNSTQLTLQSGNGQDVNACFTDDGDGVPSDATFNVTFSGTGTTVSGDIGQRNVPIEDSQSETSDC